MPKFMRGLTLKITVSAIVVLLSGFIWLPQAKAITLIPPSLELGLIPGQSLQTSIKLFNESDATVQLYPEAVDFSAN